MSKFIEIPRRFAYRARAFRFLLASIVGAGVDFLGSATALHFGAPMPLALSVGWATGLGVGYVAQAYWTFRVRPTWRSFLQFAINCALMLPVRYVAVTAMALVSPAGFYWDCTRIIAAMCITLVLNYQISRTLIFKSEKGVSRQ